MAAAKELTLKFSKGKETKNTFRYEADGHEDILYVYVTKPACKKLGNPDNISMVVKAGK